jgi:hypothetical protein
MIQCIFLFLITFVTPSAGQQFCLFSQKQKPTPGARDREKIGGDKLEKNKMEGTSWRRTRWRDQLEKKKRGDQELALEDPDERVQEFVVGAIF